MKKIIFILMCALFFTGQIIAQNRTFIGPTGQNWNALTTYWSPTGFPTASDTVLIPSGKTVAITGTANCKDVRVVGTGAIDFSGSGNLNVYRNLLNSTGNAAAFDGLAGTVTFKGTTSGNSFDGTIRGTTNLNKVIVDKFSSANVVSLVNGTEVSIRYSLYLKKGDMDARQGHSKLTLLAMDASGNWQTAYIDGTGAGNVVGKITIGQITYNNYKTYHFLCGPVLDSSQTYWTTTQLHPFYDQAIVNNTGYVYPTGTIPDFIYYDETVDAPGSGSGANNMYGWKGTNPQTTSSTRVGNGQGTCSKFKPFFTSGSPDPIQWTGIANNGNITVNLTYTNNSENGDGINLIGNPYPSPIEWQKVYDDLGEFPVIWIWQNDGGELTGSFYVYDAQNSGNTTYPETNGRIAIGQGFHLIKDPLHASSVTWKNTYRTTAIDAAFYREASKTPILNAIDIKLGGLKNKDITLIHFGDYNSTDKKPIKNITKMMNPDNSLYTINQNKFINSLNLPFPSQETTIPMGITIAENGNYYLEAANINLETLQYKAFLVDLKTKKSIEIDADFKYEFEAQKGTDNERFIIRVVNKETIANTPVSKEYALINNANLEFQLSEITNELVNAMVTDATGKTIWSGNLNLQNGRGVIKNDLLPNGLLFLNIISASKNTNFKLINVN
jgi:hypothetical protein